MKRKIIGAFLGLTAGAFLQSGTVYPAALQVTDTADGIRCVTSTGIEYHIAADAEDIHPGDLLAVVMHDSGTPDDVHDDTVLLYRYSGY